MDFRNKRDFIKEDLAEFWEGAKYATPLVVGILSFVATILLLVGEQWIWGASTGSLLVFCACWLYFATLHERWEEERKMEAEYRRLNPQYRSPFS